MNNIIIWVSICSISIIWGFLHYKAGYYTDIDKHNKYFRFLEFWRCCINYFIPLIIAYYFISVRWVYVGQGNISYGDFILGIVFLVGIFGWLPYFIKNITEGITAIFDRIFKK